MISAQQRATRATRRSTNRSAHIKGLPNNITAFYDSTPSPSSTRRPRAAHCTLYCTHVPLSALVAWWRSRHHHSFACHSIKVSSGPTRTHTHHVRTVKYCITSHTHHERRILQMLQYTLIYFQIHVHAHTRGRTNKLEWNAGDGGGGTGLLVTYCLTVLYILYSV